MGHQRRRKLKRFDGTAFTDIFTSGNLCHGRRYVLQMRSPPEWEKAVKREADAMNGFDLQIERMADYLAKRGLNC